MADHADDEIDSLCRVHCLVPSVDSFRGRVKEKTTVPSAAKRSSRKGRLCSHNRTYSRRLIDTQTKAEKPAVTAMLAAKPYAIFRPDCSTA